jgi:hypothetical protein
LTHPPLATAVSGFGFRRDKPVPKTQAANIFDYQQFYHASIYLIKEKSKRVIKKITSFRFDGRISFFPSVFLAERGSDIFSFSPFRQPVRPAPDDQSEF